MRLDPPAFVAGHGRPVLLLHGVGVGPEAFDVLASVLLDRGLMVIAPFRRGYDPGGQPSSARLDDHISDLDRILNVYRLREGAVVGVSGGATIALAAALRQPSSAGAWVFHEPLLGPLATELHADVTTSLRRMREDKQPGAGVRFVTRLAGASTVEHLNVESAAALQLRDGTATTEAPAFTRFAPTSGSLAELRPYPTLVTVGELSGQPRRAAATILSELAGSDVRTVPGSGHLPQVDAPQRFAELITGWGDAERTSTVLEA